MRAAVVALSMLLGAPFVAHATDPSPPPLPEAPYRFSVLMDQWRALPQPSAAIRHPGGITRDDVIEHVTLTETIAIALENNPGIAADRLEPTRVSADVLGAQAQFDPILGGETSRSEAEIPNASSLAATTTI